jgi:hypothetical protein
MTPIELLKSCVQEVRESNPAGGFTYLIIDKEIFEQAIIALEKQLEGKKNEKET